MLRPERRRRGTGDALATEELGGLLHPGDNAAEASLDDDLLEVVDLGAVSEGGVEGAGALEGEPGRQAGEALVALEEDAAGVWGREGRTPAEPESGAAVAVVPIEDAAADGGVGLDGGPELVAEDLVQDAGDDGAGAVERVEDAREVDGDGTEGGPGGGLPALAGGTGVLGRVAGVAGVEGEDSLGEGERGMDGRHGACRYGTAAEKLVGETEAVEGATEGGGDRGDVPGGRARIEGGHHHFTLETGVLLGQAAGADCFGFATVAGDDLVQIAVGEAGDEVEGLGDVELIESDRGAVATGGGEEHERAIARAVEAEGAGADHPIGVEAGRGAFDGRDDFRSLDEGELAGEGFEGERVGGRERDADDARGGGVDAVEG